MNILIYVIFFILGTLAGNFLTKAVYRIPIKQNLLKKAYCPYCREELKFWENIPIVSYIMLKGKCGHCKEEINPKYFLIECISGAAFVFIGLFNGISVQACSVDQIISTILSILFITFLILIAFIDLENRYIDDRLIIYGFVLALINNAYNYYIDSSYSLKRVIFYLLLVTFLLFIDIRRGKKGKYSEYLINTIFLTVIIDLFVYETTTLYIIAFTLIIFAFYNLMKTISKKKKKEKKTKLDKIKKYPFAFFICIASLLSLAELTIMTAI